MDQRRIRRRRRLHEGVRGDGLRRGVVLRSLRFHAKTVHVRANVPQKVENGVGSIIFNYKPLEGNRIPADHLRDDVNEVEVLMG
jgi:hypothetical protein